MRFFFFSLFWAFALTLTAVQAAQAQTTPTTTPPAPGGPSFDLANVQPSDSIMVTVLLKHQQDKNLTEIRRILDAQGFWDVFPPAESRVISWTMAVGLGHIIVLKMPSGAVRRLHLAITNGAFGAFDCEILLSYDYKGIWEDYIERREEAKEDRN